MARLEPGGSPDSSSYPIVPHHLRVYTIEEGYSEPEVLPFSAPTLGEHTATQSSPGAALMAEECPTAQYQRPTRSRALQHAIAAQKNAPIHAPTCKVEGNNASSCRPTDTEEQDCLHGLGHNLTSTTDNMDPASTSTRSSNGAAANMHEAQGTSALIPAPSTRSLEAKTKAAGEVEQTPKAKVTFFSIPRELRNMIYSLVAWRKSPCGQLIKGELSPCECCKHRATQVSDYEKLFALECEPSGGELAAFLKKAGSLYLFSKEVDKEFLEYLVPRYSLSLRFDIQNSQFTDFANNGPDASYKQPDGFKHTPIPERFARALRRCDVFICENHLWNDEESMERLGAALKDMENFQFARIHWVFECKEENKQKAFFRAVRHVKLKEGTLTGLSQRINVNSLPSATVEECQEDFENYC
ncbi:hypothetical protein EG328_002909 [Venturia inaequalis]|uniref:Uncharacterized protein n=1 Tax=Venturia inaequalis TaxID=5025 RepID=A0A8H3V6Y4_VENIN|nr:hypothetical protein EG328_002909 [Venturia inaequalis]KAE9982303.1 hypothetical protein EG327_005891 [Venturia inaequalis]